MSDPLQRTYVVVCGSGRERQRFRELHGKDLPAGFTRLRVLIAATAQIELRGLDVHGWEQTPEATRHREGIRNAVALEYATRRTTHRDRTVTGRIGA